MASAATRGHGERLGIGATELSAEQLRSLLDRIAPGLRVFIGSARATEVMASIENALGLVEETP
jgi:hypothetical protein